MLLKQSTAAQLQATDYCNQDKLLLHPCNACTRPACCPSPPKEEERSAGIQEQSSTLHTARSCRCALQPACGVIPSIHATNNSLLRDTTLGCHTFTIISSKAVEHQCLVPRAPDTAIPTPTLLGCVVQPLCEHSQAVRKVHSVWLGTHHATTRQQVSGKNVQGIIGCVVIHRPWARLTTCSSSDGLQCVTHPLETLPAQQTGKRRQRLHQAPSTFSTHPNT